MKTKMEIKQFGIQQLNLVLKKMVKILHIIVLTQLFLNYIKNIKNNNFQLQDQFRNKKVVIKLIHKICIKIKQNDFMQ